MKKKLSILFAVVLTAFAISALGFISGAADFEFLFSLSDAELTITGYTGTMPDELIIPSQIDGNPVTAIGERAFSGAPMKKLIIEKGVKTLNKCSFENCTALTEVKVPETFKETFNSVTSFAYAPFKGCKNITTFTFDGANEIIPDYICYGLNNLTKISFPDGLKTIGEYAFYNCSSLENIAFPDSLEVIDKCAFGECTSLTEISIPQSVTNYGVNYSISSAPFYGCDNIKTVTFEGTRDKIPDYICANLKNLTQINFPTDIKTIGEYAFYNCTALESIEFPETVKSVERFAFSGCSYLKYIDFNNVETLGNNAFRNCESLSAILIPEKLSAKVSVATNAPFYGCDNIKTVTFEGTREEIPGYICAYIKNLTQINFPDGLKTIGEYAFYNCSSLENIDFPDSLEVIDKCAFGDCTSLTEISIPQLVTNYGVNYSISSAPFYGCDNIKTVTFEGTRDKIPDYICAYLKNLTQINFPTDVKTIGEYAFYSCIALESVEFPDTVKSIEKYAFARCSYLKYIDFNNIETLANNAFGNCKSLSTVTIPENLSVKKVAGSSNVPFYGCDNIEVVKFEGTDIKPYICNYMKNLHTVDMLNGFSSVDSKAFTSSGEIKNFIIRSSLVTPPDSESAIPESATIYGFSSSPAEQYALKYSRKFISLDSFISYDEITEYVREQMLSRNKYIIFSYDADDLNVDSPDTLRRFVNDIFRYDSSKPNQGDYLRWNLSSLAIVKSVSDGKLIYTIEADYLTSEAQENEATAIVNEIIDSLNLKQKSDYEKIKLIFDYIAQNTACTNDEKDEPVYHSGYSVLSNKEGNCEGFAMAFYRLALESGLESRIVVNESLRHAWNIVKLEDKWYYIDTFYSALDENENNEAFYFLKKAITVASADGETALEPEYEDDDDIYYLSLTPFSKDAYPIADSDYLMPGQCIHEIVFDEIEGLICQGNATQKSHCVKCSAIFTRPIEKGDHIDEDLNKRCDVCGEKLCRHLSFNRVKVPRKNATCTEDGLSYYEYCKDCEEIIVEATIIPATGHIDKDGNGSCDNCGKTTNYFKKAVDFFFGPLKKIVKLLTTLFGKKK